MHFTALLQLSSFLFLLGRPETVTFYAVLSSNATVVTQNSYSFSIGGVNSRGQTTYVQEVVQSEAYGYPTSDTELQTVTITAQTIYATLIQDATVQIFSESPASSDAPGVYRSCSIGNDERGVCVAEVWLPGQPTFTTTYQGTAVPYYTLTEPPTATSPGTAPGAKTTNSTQSSSSTRASSAAGVSQGRLTHVATITIIIGVVGGLLLLYDSMLVVSHIGVVVADTIAHDNLAYLHFITMQTET